LLTASTIDGLTVEERKKKNGIKEGQLHWDGIPLREDELNIILAFLKKAKERKDAKERDDK
jgi:hypothetical protein